MTTYTHADLVAAIERAACPQMRSASDQWAARSINAHLDTLAAILALHGSWQHSDDAYPWCLTCSDKDHGGQDRWPCQTVQVVVDALTRMGAL